MNCIVLIVRTTDLNTILSNLWYYHNKPDTLRPLMVLVLNAQLEINSHATCAFPNVCDSQVYYSLDTKYVQNNTKLICPC